MSAPFQGTRGGRKLWSNVVRCHKKESTDMETIKQIHIFKSANAVCTLSVGILIQYVYHCFKDYLNTTYNHLFN